MSQNFETNKKMIECCICLQSLEELNALPCGHCVCGPPRSCRTSLAADDVSFVKCPVCKTQHKFTLKDLKPLYGIRDYLKRRGPEENAAAEYPKIVASKCFSYRCKLDTKFWCATCEKSVCQVCFDESHQGHQVQNHILYLEEASKASAKKFRSLREELPKLVSICKNELEMLKFESSLVDKTLENLSTTLDEINRLAPTNEKIEEAIKYKQALIKDTVIKGFLEHVGSFHPAMSSVNSVSLEFRSKLRSLDLEVWKLEGGILTQPVRFDDTLIRILIKKANCREKLDPLVKGFGVFLVCQPLGNADTLNLKFKLELTGQHGGRSFAIQDGTAETKFEFKEERSSR